MNHHGKKITVGGTEDLDEITVTSQTFIVIPYFEFIGWLSHMANS